MKSIRRTLLLNVLLLLLATLAVVSYFVYHTAEAALVERQNTAHQLAELRYEDRRDEALRNRADELASEVQSNWNRDKFRDQWLASGFLAMAAPFTPSGPVPLLVRSVTAGPGPIGFQVNLRLSTELRLNEDELYRDAMTASHEFIQVTSDSGGTWTSRSLSGHQFIVEDNSSHTDSESRNARFDNALLPNGMTLRRVIVKAPVTRFSRVGSFWLPRPQRTDESPPISRAVVGLGGAVRFFDRKFGAPPERPGPPPSSGLGPGYSLPNFYLQCAWDTSPENPYLAPLIRERDAQVADIDERTALAVSTLRSRLAWTVAGGVAATLILGWILVGLGLFPLKRLSFAVSQITPKDLRLPLDPGTLPNEINPVADRLKQSLTQLQAAFEREKRAAADISHELRTPLAALTTTIEVACRKTRTAEQYLQTLEECRGIAKQMSLLVERMLTLAWLDAGADRVRPEKVEVSELVTGVAAIGKPLAEAHGLSFRVDTPGPLTIQTDPDKVREVVMNLIHNAIEYNRPGGEVVLTASPTTHGVILEVRDTGIGMAPETQEKIFERFYRGDPSRQATGVHAGLGLAIVKEYVDVLGGKLMVDSALGRGSRFRVELPNAL